MLEPLALRPVAADEQAAFAGFTFPAYQRRWWAGEPLVAIALWQDDAPAGLALATPPVNGQSELLSLYVAPDKRGRGFAHGLLAALEGALAEAGARKVIVTYVHEHPARPAIERVLASASWTPSVPRMLMFQAELATMRTARWLQNVALEPGDELVPWPELAEPERETLAVWQRAEEWIPEDLLPWRHEAGCEPGTSLALRRDGRVVGWVLTHALDDGTLRFSSGWVHPALQRRGRLFALYGAAGDRAIAAGFTRASWTVPLHHEAKAAFARRWMAPYARCRETRGSAKLLVRE